MNWLALILILPPLDPEVLEGGLIRGVPLICGTRIIRLLSEGLTTVVPPVSDTGTIKPLLGLIVSVPACVSWTEVLSGISSAAKAQFPEAIAPPTANILASHNCLQLVCNIPLTTLILIGIYSRILKLRILDYFFAFLRLDCKPSCSYLTNKGQFIQGN
jgi:hypothetical protein